MVRGHVQSVFRHPSGFLEGLRVGRFSWFLNSGVYLYKIGDTLIDTGCPNSWTPITKEWDLTKVHQVLITHYHEDHSGNGGDLQQLGIPVYAPSASIPYLSAGYQMEWYRRVFWGSPRSTFTPEAAPERLTATSNGTQFTVEPIFSDGHSDDHTCVYVPEMKWLFSADLFVTRAPQLARFDEDMGAHIRSLRRIIGLDFEEVFCAHRGYIPDGKKALSSRLQYLEQLRSKIVEKMSQGMSIEQVTQAVLGRENFMSIMTGGDFSKRGLVKKLWEADV